MEADYFMKTCILIDGNSLLYRMFYGIRGMTNSKGVPTNALYGFINMLYKIQEEYQPAYLAVAFDLAEPTFRHQKYDAYKAGRDKMPEELQEQFDILKNMLEQMQIKILTLKGYEADDIIGTVSRWGANQNINVNIITGDRDSFQLVSDQVHVFYTTTRSGNQFTVIDPDYIQDKYGVLPKELIEVKALMGDTSDNIPGISGIGEKTALKLVKKYHDLDTLYEHTDDLKGKQKERIISGKEDAYQSRFLGEINQNAPVESSFEQMVMKPLFNDAVIKTLTTLEFSSILKKVTQEHSNTIKGEKNTHPYSIISHSKDLYFICGHLAKESKLVIHARETEDALCLAFQLGHQFYYIDHTDLAESFLNTLLDLPNADDIKIIGYNLKELSHLFRRHGGSLVNYGYDVYIAAYLLNPSDNRYDLKTLALRFLDRPILGEEDFLGKGKKRVAWTDKSEREIADFIIEECAVVADLYAILPKAVEQMEMTGLMNQIEMPLIEIMASMEYQGFKIDLDALTHLSKTFETRIEDLSEEIYEIAGETFNINSTKQLGTILFDKLELPAVKKTKTGYSTSVDVLEQLRPFHPIVPDILEYRTVSKLDSTYGKGLIKLVDPKTKKVYSHFNQTVTATGRISSSDPNLQNIPVKTDLGREIRRVFIPSASDRLLLDADYSQIELRVLAHLTGDKNLIEAFVENQDIHTRTASEIFGVSMDTVTREQRSRAKAINFGLIYGKQAFSLGKELGISRKEAQDYIDMYFARYPGVQKYMDDIRVSAKEKGYVTTLWGRRRYIPEIKSRNRMVAQSGERMALNTPIQGSAADIMKIAMIRVYRRLEQEQLNSHLILQVHDELIVDTDESEKKKVMNILIDEMEHAVTLNVPLIVDAHAGKSWYELK